MKFLQIALIATEMVKNMKKPKNFHTKKILVNFRRNPQSRDAHGRHSLVIALEVVKKVIGCCSSSGLPVILGFNERTASCVIPYVGFCSSGGNTVRYRLLPSDIQLLLGIGILEIAVIGFGI